MSIQDIVHSALNNALDDGYDFEDWTVDEIVDDLIAYDADLEDVPAHEIKPHVESWLAEQA